MEELIIQETETRQKLVETINNSGLPAFALEAIVKDIYEQLQKEKERQLNSAIQKREQQKEKEKNKKKEVKDEQN